GDERKMHMGARDGKGEWGIGHASDADVTLTTDYVTAKQVFVSGDPNAGMQAFMQGKVRVQGDMAKLMASQQGGGNPKLTKAIQAATGERRASALDRVQLPFTRHALEGVLAATDEDEPRPGDQIDDGPRHQHLPLAGGGGDPGRQVHGNPGDVP